MDSAGPPTRGETGIDRRAGVRAVFGMIPGAALTLAAIALVLRVALVAATPGYEPVHDALAYDAHAESILAGDGYPEATLPSAGGPSAFRPPLYPHLLAGTYALGPDNLTAGRLLGAVLGSVAVLLIYLLADRLWGRRAALVAGGLSAVFPPLITLSAGLNVESLFIPIELGLVLALLAYQRSGGALRWALAAGALLGLVSVTRANGFLLAIPLVLALVMVGGRSALRRSAGASAAALAVAALVVAPWTTRNAIAFDGEFIPVTTSFGYALIGTYSDPARLDEEAKGEWHLPQDDPATASLLLRRDLDEKELDDELASRGLEYIRDHPGYALEAIARNGYRLLYPRASPHLMKVSYTATGIPSSLRDIVTYSYLAVVLLAIGGAIVAIRQRALGPMWLWSVPVVIGLSFAIFNGEPRYRTTIDPFIVLLAGLALVAAVERWRRRPSSSPLDRQLSS